MLYDKIQHDGWDLVAQFRLVLYLPLDLTPRAVFYHTARVYDALTSICWFCVGGLLVLSSAIRCEELDSRLYECKIIA